MKVKISRTSTDFHRYIRVRQFKDFNELCQYGLRKHSCLIINTPFEDEKPKFDYELEIYDEQVRK